MSPVLTHIMLFGDLWEWPGKCLDFHLLLIVDLQQRLLFIVFVKIKVIMQLTEDLSSTEKIGSQ